MWYKFKDVSHNYYFFLEHIGGDKKIYMGKLLLEGVRLEEK